mgnify:CR=1 FL=1
MTYAAEVGYVSYLSIASNSRCTGAIRDYLYTKHKINLDVNWYSDWGKMTIKLYKYVLLNDKLLGTQSTIIDQNKTYTCD